MKSVGIHVRLTENETEHFAVMDHRVVWHEGMNLLGKSDVWDSLIRVEDGLSVSTSAQIMQQKSVTRPVELVLCLSVLLQKLRSDICGYGQEKKSLLQVWQR